MKPSSIVMSVAVLLMTAVTIGADMTPTSPTAGSTLTITGPDHHIEPGEEVDLLIEGLTLDEIKQAKAEDRFDVTVFPLAGVKIDASYDWLFDTLELEFEADRPGEYLVKLHLVRESVLEIAAIVVTVEGDSPNPQPGPDPEPGPTPPLQDLMVTIITEADDQLIGLEGAYLSNHIEQVRAYLKHLNVQYRIWDQDQPIATNFVEVLKEKSLTRTPAMVVSAPSNNNQLIGADCFGDDAANTIQILKAMGVK